MPPPLRVPGDLGAFNYPARREGAVPTPALQTTVVWLAAEGIPPRVRRKLVRLVESLAPQLNEFEASLDDLHRQASNGLEWLMPKIEATIPLYEEAMVFRLKLLRLDETQMVLETRDGVAVAEITLT